MDNEQFTGEDLRQARRSAGLSIEQAARWSGRHRTTITRMERGASRADVAVFNLWRCLGGYIAAPGWCGWVFDNGCLFPPGWDRHGFTPGQVMAMQYQGALIRALKMERAARAPARFAAVHASGRT